MNSQQSGPSNPNQPVPATPTNQSQQFQPASPSNSHQPVPATPTNQSQQSSKRPPNAVSGDDAAAIAELGRLDPLSEKECKTGVPGDLFNPFFEHLFAALLQRGNLPQDISQVLKTSEAVHTQLGIDDPGKREGAILDTLEARIGEISSNIGQEAETVCIVPLGIGIPSSDSGHMVALAIKIHKEADKNEYKLIAHLCNGGYGATLLGGDGSFAPESFTLFHQSETSDDKGGYCPLIVNDFSAPLQEFLEELKDSRPKKGSELPTLAMLRGQLLTSEISQMSTPTITSSLIPRQTQQNCMTANFIAALAQCLPKEEQASDPQSQSPIEVATQLISDAIRAYNPPTHPSAEIPEEDIATLTQQETT